MTWEHGIYLLGVAAVIGGYWWFKYGRYGTGDQYYATKLGLGEGESIVEFWRGAYHIDRTLGSYVWEAFGAGAERGAMLAIAITSSDRLAIGALETSDRALSFGRGEAFASGHNAKPKYDSFRGAQGLEQATVMLLTTVSGRKLALEVPRSCLLRVQAWATPAASTHPVA